MNDRETSATQGASEPAPPPRYSIGQGGEDEHGLILILDRRTNSIIATVHPGAWMEVRELVRRANAADGKGD